MADRHRGGCNRAIRQREAMMATSLEDITNEYVLRLEKSHARLLGLVLEIWRTQEMDYVEDFRVGVNAIIAAARPRR